MLIYIFVVRVVELVIVFAFTRDSTMYKEYINFCGEDGSNRELKVSALAPEIFLNPC
jgi:hypothetical protein